MQFFWLNLLLGVSGLYDEHGDFGNLSWFPGLYNGAPGLFNEASGPHNEASGFHNEASGAP